MVCYYCAQIKALTDNMMRQEEEKTLTDKLNSRTSSLLAHPQPLNHTNKLPFLTEKRFRNLLGKTLHVCYYDFRGNHTRVN